jgi:hypothetical protein
MPPMPDNSRRTGAAIEAHYRFLAWLVPTIEKFPKSHKFTIADRIETVALDVLEALIASVAGHRPRPARGRDHEIAEGLVQAVALRVDKATCSNISPMSHTMAPEIGLRLLEQRRAAAGRDSGLVRAVDLSHVLRNVDLRRGCPCYPALGLCFTQSICFRSASVPVAAGGVSVWMWRDQGQSLHETENRLHIFG